MGRGTFAVTCRNRIYTRIDSNARRNAIQADSSCLSILERRLSLVFLIPSFLLPPLDGQPLLPLDGQPSQPVPAACILAVFFAEAYPSRQGEVTHDLASTLCQWSLRPRHLSSCRSRLPSMRGSKFCFYPITSATSTPALLSTSWRVSLGNSCRFHSNCRFSKVSCLRPGK